jgi:hypothetical protein
MQFCIIIYGFWDPYKEALLWKVFDSYQTSFLYRQLVQLISQVTIDDLNQVGPKYVAPLFNPETSKTSIVCHPSKIEEIAAGFQE